jgi:hypothetical protein
MCLSFPLPFFVSSTPLFQRNIFSGIFANTIAFYGRRQPNNRSFGLPSQRQRASLSRCHVSAHAVTSVVFHVLCLYSTYRLCFIVLTAVAVLPRQQSVGLGVWHTHLVEMQNVDCSHFAGLLLDKRSISRPWEFLPRLHL